MVHDRQKVSILHKEAIQKRSQPKQAPFYPVKGFVTIIQMYPVCFKGPLGAKQFTRKNTEVQEVFATWPKKQKC
jgi:hypothetical protein